jgi:hypothetical protein
MTKESKKTDTERMEGNMQLRSLHLSLRFVLPLALVLGLFAFAIVPLIDNLTLRWFVRELDTRSQLLANALQDPLLDYVPQKSAKKINQLFDRAIQDERLFAVAFCDTNGKVVYKTVTYPESLHCGNPQVTNGIRQSLVTTQQGSLHITESAVNSEFERLGKLMLVSDMSFIERRSADTRRYVITLFALLAVVISLITHELARLDQFSQGHIARQPGCAAATARAAHHIGHAGTGLAAGNSSA